MRDDQVTRIVWNIRMAAAMIGFSIMFAAYIATV